jgi:hypothetical protein
MNYSISKLIDINSISSDKLSIDKSILSDFLDKLKYDNHFSNILADKSASNGQLTISTNKPIGFSVPGTDFEDLVIKNFPKDYTGRLWDMHIERTKIYGHYGGTSLSVADGITKCLLFGELDADDRDLFRLKWQSKREEGIQRIFTGRRIQ